MRHVKTTSGNVCGVGLNIRDMNIALRLDWRDTPSNADLQQALKSISLWLKTWGYNIDGELLYVTNHGNDPLAKARAYFASRKFLKDGDVGHAASIFKLPKEKIICY